MELATLFSLLAFSICTATMIATKRDPPTTFVIWVFIFWILSGSSTLICAIVGALLT